MSTFEVPPETFEKMLDPTPDDAPRLRAMAQRDDRVWPKEHVRPEREDEPNWGWLDLWQRENPYPDDHSDFDAWYAEQRKMADRIWVAYCLPDFLVWDWSDGDVAVARRLVAQHVCGVCGRADDPGCGLGC